MKPLIPTVIAVTLTSLAMIEAAEPEPSKQAHPTKALPVAGDVFEIEGNIAFLIPAKNSLSTSKKPWVWYAPTLPGLPAITEQWMFQQFLAAGISIAGIDVGESYGSPSGRKLYSALYTELAKNRGYSSKPVLLGRSRGGLMTLSWAVENPDKVAAFAGIYPVSDLTSYPGVEKASKAYAMSASDLQKSIKEHNPIDRLDALAKAGIPLFVLHGDADKVVPLENNSAELRRRYRSLGGTIDLTVPPGQGHNMWPGFFQSQELVDFVKANAH